MHASNTRAHLIQAIELRVPLLIALHRAQGFDLLQSEVSGEDALVDLSLIHI